MLYQGEEFVNCGTCGRAAVSKNSYNIREAIEQVLVPKKASNRPLLHDRDSGPIVKR